MESIIGETAGDEDRGIEFAGRVACLLDEIGDDELLDSGGLWKVSGGGLDPVDIVNNVSNSDFLSNSFVDPDFGQKGV